MSKWSFSDYIFRYSGALHSLLFLGFLGLAIINHAFNFDLPKNTKIRDASEVSIMFDNFSEISAITGEKSLLPSSFVSAVPRTGSSNTPSPYASSKSSTFTISNPIMVSDPSVDAGSSILRYNNGRNGGRFLYAHSSRAFNPLKSIYEGEKITVTMDGSTSTYSVASRKVFNKASELDNNAARRLALYSSQYNGKSYDLTLMTCGNGSNDDSNFRLVLFLNKA